VGVEEILTLALALKRDQHSTVGAPEVKGLMRRRVGPTYSICYSARAQTLGSAPNQPSVFALIFASVFTGGGPSVFKPFPVRSPFSAAWVGEQTAPFSTTMAKSRSDYNRQA
jgi:hypothetical protein